MISVDLTESSTSMVKSWKNRSRVRKEDLWGRTYFWKISGIPSRPKPLLLLTKDYLIIESDIQGNWRISGDKTVARLYHYKNILLVGCGKFCLIYFPEDLRRINFVYYSKLSHMIRLYRFFLVKCCSTVSADNQTHVFVVWSFIEPSSPVTRITEGRSVIPQVIFPTWRLLKSSFLQNYTLVLVCPVI